MYNIIYNMISDSMSLYKEEDLTFLCSDEYDPSSDTPQKFASAWELLTERLDDIKQRIDDGKFLLQELKEESVECQTTTHPDP